MGRRLSLALGVCLRGGRAREAEKLGHGVGVIMVRNLGGGVDRGAPRKEMVGKKLTAKSCAYIHHIPLSELGPRVTLAMYIVILTW